MNLRAFGAFRAPARLLMIGSLTAALGAAQAESFTLSGNFGQDDQVLLLSLRLDTAGTFSATSLGYAGGLDTNGVLHAAGGFDTMLFLYNAAGVLIAQSDDGVSVPTDPSTGLSADAAFSISLPAGQYTLALTQYDNFALGDFSSGFSAAGTGNFTPALSGTCSASAFCDWTGDARSSSWTLAMTGVSAVPEPSAMALLLAGGAGLLAWRRRSAVKP